MYFKVRLFNDPATLLVIFTNFSSFNGWNSMRHRYIMISFPSIDVPVMHYRYSIVCLYNYAPYIQ